MYPLLRRALFLLPPEWAHQVSLQGLGLLHRIKQLPTSILPPKPTHVMGLSFPNPVGLAAGMDKNGDYIHALAALGFGFIEVGTVTPKAQKGNPKPRLFRLPHEHALINRMGFNNKGVDYLIHRLQHYPFSGILGINIGKNKDTPLHLAINDYITCLRKIYIQASYIVVNLSSPNTPGLRHLQTGTMLREMLSALKDEQHRLTTQYKHYTPMVIKIAPDMEEHDIIDIAQCLQHFEIDGVIATNTTLSRQNMMHSTLTYQEGGLSGAPLKERATHTLRILATHIKGRTTHHRCRRHYAL